MAAPQPDTLLTAAVSLLSLSLSPSCQKDIYVSATGWVRVNQDKKWNGWTQQGSGGCFTTLRSPAPELPRWARVILRRFPCITTLWAHDFFPGMEADDSPNAHLTGKLGDEISLWMGRHFETLTMPCNCKELTFLLPLNITPGRPASHTQSGLFQPEIQVLFLGKKVSFSIYF